MLDESKEDKLRIQKMCSFCGLCCFNPVETIGSANKQLSGASL